MTDIYDNINIDRDTDTDTNTGDIIWGYYVGMLIEAIRKEKDTHYLSALLEMDSHSLVLVQEVRGAISARIRGMYRTSCGGR